MDTYSQQPRPHIAISHYIENSHDGNDRANQLDQDLYEFLKRNFDANKFSNTAIFLYSDHGSRFSSERMNHQGSMEERMPFFSLFLPETFRLKHRQKYENLMRNAQQLTSPLDIYATLRDVSCLAPAPINAKNPLRSISLLDKIPENRTCKEIDISLHYCICELDWVLLNVQDSANKYTLTL
jgi:hypothetical protein